MHPTYVVALPACEYRASGMAGAKYPLDKVKEAVKEAEAKMQGRTGKSGKVMLEG